MKYPEKQYNKALTVLKALAPHFDNIKEVHPSNIHFLIYQQLSEGQRHNAFVVDKDNNIYRKHFADSTGIESKFLFDVDNSFELYPAGTHDNHIETAMKKALKAL